MQILSTFRITVIGGSVGSVEMAIFRMFAGNDCSLTC